MSPRPDVSAERTGQILDAAAAVFARLGFNKARMDDIVQESGLSKGALYWYFKSKDAIIAALLQRFFDRELKDLQGLLEADGPASERLLLATRHVAAKIKRLSMLMPVAYEFYAVAARQKTVRQFLKDYFKTYREALADLIQQGVDRDEFRAVPAEETAITLIALYEGLTLLWVVDPQVFDWGEQAQAGVRLLLEGITTRA